MPQDNLGAVQRSLSSDPNCSAKVTFKLYIIKIKTNLFTPSLYWDHFCIHYTFDILHVIEVRVRLHHKMMSCGITMTWGTRRRVLLSNCLPELCRTVWWLI